MEFKHEIICVEPNWQSRIYPVPFSIIKVGYDNPTKLRVHIAKGHQEAIHIWCGNESHAPDTTLLIKDGHHINMAATRGILACDIVSCENENISVLYYTLASNDTKYCVPFRLEVIPKE